MNLTDRQPRDFECDFTPEDKRVWFRMYQLDPFTHLAFAGIYASTDRRDANRMLVREGFRQQCANLRAPPMRPALWLLFMGDPTS